MNSKQASAIMHLPIDTLRYYERIGLVPPVQRTENGYRNYRTVDLNWIFIVKRLREAGLSIEAVKEYSELTRAKGDTSDAKKDLIREQLTELDNKIADLNRTRALLQYKFDTFDHHLGQFGEKGIGPHPRERLWKNPRFNKHMDETFAEKFTKEK